MKILLSLFPLLIGIIIYRNSFVFDPWVSNYLPDGLWSFSFTSSLFFVQGEKKYFFNIILVVGLGITIEFLQLSNHIKGTFDFVDIVVYFIAAILAVIIDRFLKK